MASSKVSLLPPAPRGRQKVADVAGFRPSPVQRRFVQLALAAQGPLKIAPICKQIGISRTSYYRWLDQPGFRSWMSAQWVMALQADGGRLLSIAQARAGSDFRYWRALADLIFDPRGLGLLTAWQQRLASGDDLPETSAPLFEDGDAEIDADLRALDGDGYETLMARMQRVAAAQAAQAEPVEEKQPAVEEAPAADAEVPAVPPSAPVESADCEAPAVQFSDSAPDPDPSPDVEVDDDETSSSEETYPPWPRPAPGKRFWF